MKFENGEITYDYDERLNAYRRSTRGSMVRGIVYKLAALSAVVALMSAAFVAGQQKIDPAPVRDPFAQSAFPCQEDEGLMYGPEFGADRVGCVAIDDACNDCYDPVRTCNPAIAGDCESAYDSYTEGMR